MGPLSFDVGGAFAPTCAVITDLIKIYFRMIKMFTVIIPINLLFFFNKNIPNAKTILYSLATLSPLTKNLEKFYKNEARHPLYFPIFCFVLFFFCVKRGQSHVKITDS